MLIKLKDWLTETNLRTNMTVVFIYIFTAIFAGLIVGSTWYLTSK